MTDEVPKAPLNLSVTEGSPHKVEKMGDGRFMAEAAEKSWRRLDGHNQLPKIILARRPTSSLALIDSHLRAEKREFWGLVSVPNFPISVFAS